jgi:hypothetical protein
LDENVGDWISARPNGVAGVEDDSNRTKDNREGEAKPCFASSPAVRVREFDQAATKPELLFFATFSDAVDSMLAMESLSDCLSAETWRFALNPSFNFWRREGLDREESES